MVKSFFKFISITLLFVSVLFGQEKVSYRSLPVHHAPDKKFHMIHLSLNLHFNISKEEIIGSATEKIVPLGTEYKTIHLDAMDMTIKKVTLGKKILTYNYDGKILSVNLDKPYDFTDTLTFTVDYITVPPRRGIFFIMPDSAYPNVTPQLWSQSESEDARYWYPCHDYPDDYSTSSITATVPAGWVVVSNGLLKKVETNKNERTETFFWVEDKPHVVYLNSIVVGKFKILKTRWDNVPIEYYVSPQYVEDAKSNFSHTPDILKYFSNVTGYHYPWQKLSLSGVSQFTAGGMENVSAITLTDETFHDKNAHPEETTTDLVSHETAHQWFGDLLTCRTWANVWLNEGFATYFEALYGEHAFGKDHFIYEMYKDHQLVLNAEKHGRMPTVDDRYNTADDAFGVNVYERGASILHMLKTILGDRLFFKAIRQYVYKNQFHNVDTHDFEIAVQNATGRNLYWFYNEWLYQGGHPIFKVKYNYDENTHKLYMNVAQTQKIDSLTPVYKMPVDIFIVTKSQKITEQILVDSVTNSYVFDVPAKPLMVNFDEENALLKEIHFDKNVDELIYQLKNDPNVVGRLWAAEQLGKKKDDKAEDALVAELKDDGFNEVRAASAEALSNFQNDKAKNALFLAVNDEDADVQISTVKALGKFKEDDVAKKLEEIFNNASVYPIKAVAVSSLASVDSLKALPVIYKALNMDSYRQEIRVAALNALVKIDSNNAYAEAENFAKYGQPETIRLHAIEIMIKLNRDNITTMKLLKKYSEDPYWMARLVAINGLGKIGDKKILSFLKKLENKVDDYRILESVRRAIKEIEVRTNKS